MFVRDQDKAMVAAAHGRIRQIIAKARQLGEPTRDAKTPFDANGRSIVIMMTPRSGSTLLSSLISLTGKLGRCAEHFNNRPGGALEQTASRHRVHSVDQLLNAVMNTTANNSGVFSIKGDFRQFAPFLGMRNFWEKLRNPAFFYLTREDLLAQAISYEKALQTRQTTSTVAAVGEAVYDEAKLLQDVEYLTQMMASFEFLFATNGIQPTRLTYEALSEDPVAVVRTIGKAIGIDDLPPMSRDDSPLRKQADALTEEWRRRFAEQSVGQRI